MLKYLVPLGLILVMAVATAAPPPATATSSESFLLRGKSVPVAGVPSWPVLAGDEVLAGKMPVVFTFRDGSRISLGENSKARVEEKEGQLSFRLLSGVMQVTRASKNSPAIFSLAKAVEVAPGVATKVDAAGGVSRVQTNARVLTPRPPSTPPPVSNR